MVKFSPFEQHPRHLPIDRKVLDARFNKLEQNPALIVRAELAKASVLAANEKGEEGWGDEVVGI